MKQSLLQEKYPIFALEIEKPETRFHSVDEIIVYLKERIDNHSVAKYIGEFDHYAHTCSLQDGQISADILAAKNIIFCFGLTLPDPKVLAVRPRSIGVAETRRTFIITFMEAPMPVANIAMEDWAKSVRNGLTA